MKTHRIAVLLALAFPGTAVAQGAIGVAAHAGSLGLGIDGAVSLSSRVGVRASANFFPMEVNVDASDLTYSFSFPSPQYLLLLDLQAAGPLRLSGGVMISPEDFEVTATPVGSVAIGGVTYTGAQIGTLTGAIVNKDVAPYLGIGIGNVTRSRVGFLLDLGLAFHGAPEVSLTASGPATTLPGFAADLAREATEFEDDIKFLNMYPVLSVGLSFRLTP